MKKNVRSYCCHNNNIRVRVVGWLTSQGEVTLGTNYTAHFTGMILYVMGGNSWIISAVHSLHLVVETELIGHLVCK